MDAMKSSVAKHTILISRDPEQAIPVSRQQDMSGRKDGGEKRSFHDTLVDQSQVMKRQKAEFCEIGRITHTNPS